MNAPDPQAQDLAAIFNGFGAVRLNFGAKPASKLVPSSSIPLPAGLQQSIIADTVCKNSILETVDSWDGFRKLVFLPLPTTRLRAVKFSLTAVESGQVWLEWE